MIITVLILLMSPLGLEWYDTHVKAPKIDSYTRMTGTPLAGLIVYLGDDLDEMEAELQLEYQSGKLSTALLILGPAGIDRFNCAIKYKKVVSSLSEKYGMYSRRETIRDPIINDLVSDGGFCKQVSIGLYEARTFWRIKQFRIVADLVGDNSEFYIHVYYSLISTGEKIRKKKILKRL